LEGNLIFLLLEIEIGKSEKWSGEFLNLQIENIHIDLCKNLSINTCLFIL